jgi:hypothetical protein
LVDPANPGRLGAAALASGGVLGWAVDGVPAGVRTRLDE